MAPRLAFVVSAVVVLALAGPACVVAQPDGPTAQVTPPSGPPPGPPPPPAAGPGEVYPPEPSAPPPPQAQAGVPQGQWVYTQQYGWLWMTYGDAYAYVPPNGFGEPLEYVYYPSYGRWAWVAAPWVWGIGPWPYFGRRGPTHFAWYSRGYWREPSRWRYRPAPEPRGVTTRGVRPPPATRQARRPDRARGPQEQPGRAQEQPGRVEQGRPRGQQERGREQEERGRGGGERRDGGEERR